MREGSREQTGCVLAIFMLSSAVFAVRSVLRASYRMAGTTEPAVTPVHLAIVLGLAVAIVVLAIFALKLKTWALVAYGVASVAGVALSLHWELQIAVPLLIGLCGVAAVSFVRRDVF